MGLDLGFRGGVGFLGPGSGECKPSIFVGAAFNAGKACKIQCFLYTRSVCIMLACATRSICFSDFFQDLCDFEFVRVVRDVIIS